MRKKYTDIKHTVILHLTPAQWKELMAILKAGAAPNKALRDAAKRYHALRAAGKIR